MDDEQRTPSGEEQAKARRRKMILDRLNSMDTGVSRDDREQEERRAHGIDIAGAKERRPEPGTFGGSGC